MPGRQHNSNSEETSAAGTRPPYSRAVQPIKNTDGRFASTFGFRKLRLPDANRTQLLVFDGHWQLVPQLGLWYRLRSAYGAARTRETYLAVLCPFMGFLLEMGYRWDARPEHVREYVRQYLVASGCRVRPDRTSDGYQVTLDRAATFTASGLGLFISASRDFYRVLAEGEWMPSDRLRRLLGNPPPMEGERLVVDTPGELRHVSYYAYPNPMYSALLLQWRREHIRALAAAGAPDEAGIRGASHADTQRMPVGYFRVRRNPWEPAVAGEAPLVRLLIKAAITYMIDHAPPRERVILSLLRDTGARLNEILRLTAGGYRNGQSALVGTRALVQNKGSMGRETKAVTFSSETAWLLRWYVRTERARHDAKGRDQIKQLPDDEPLFLSRRGRRLSDAGFRSRWVHLRKQAERHFRHGPVPLPHLHPHIIRHLNATERFVLAAEMAGDDHDRQQALDAAIREDMAWQSEETARCYRHVISKAEAMDEFQSRFIARVTSGPSTLPEVIAEVHRQQGVASAPGLAFDSETEDTLTWLKGLGQGRSS